MVGEDTPYFPQKRRNFSPRSYSIRKKREICEERTKNCDAPAKSCEGTLSALKGNTRLIFPVKDNGACIESNAK